MAKYSKAKINNFFSLNGAITDAERGKALEDLVSYLFSKIPGIEQNLRDINDDYISEELDLVFWNNRHPKGFKAISFPDVIIVECKNRKNKVSSSEIRSFINKIDDSGQNFGIMVSLNGITGKPKSKSHANLPIITARKDGIRIIVFTENDIKKLNTTDDIIKSCQQKLCGLGAGRVIV